MNSDATRQAVAALLSAPAAARPPPAAQPTTAAMPVAMPPPVMEMTLEPGPRMPQSPVCDAVIFCFNLMPNEVSSDLRGRRQQRGYVSEAIMWALERLGDRYKHVECLFHSKGDQEDINNWRALTTFEKTGSGVYYHTYRYFKGGRWEMYKLTDLPHTLRLKLWEFAWRENERPRTYQTMALLNTVPSTSCLGACTPRSDSVYCAQLMLELMQYAFPELWRDIAPNSLRPDGFFDALRRRHRIEHVVLDLVAPNLRTHEQVQRLIRDNPAK